MTMKDVQKRTQLFVEITRVHDQSCEFYTDVEYRKESLPVSGQDQALSLSLQKRADWFRTYEVTTVTINGLDYGGARENISGIRYLTRDSGLFSSEEVLNAVPLRMRDYPAYDDYKTDAARNSAYIRAPGDASGRFVKLEPGMQVFSSRDGSRLWPPEAPAPAPSALPPPTASGRTGSNWPRWKRANP